MVRMRAKVKVDSITKTQYSEKLKLSAVYSGDKNSEDNTFSEATPDASFEMSITNKALHGQFKPGETFYVDFTPADK